MTFKYYFLPTNHRSQTDQFYCANNRSISSEIRIKNRFDSDNLTMIHRLTRTYAKYKQKC